MMNGLNKVTLIGRVGVEVEVRQTQTGTKVAQFSLATNESYTSKEGKKVESTEWHRIILWAKLADLAESFLKKGSLVYVEGKIKTRAWKDNSGTEKFTTEIIASNFLKLSNEEVGNKSRGGQEDFLEDDVPF